MTRFLTVASTALLASSLAVLPVASFAQTGAAAPADATTTQAPVVSHDKTQPTKVAPAEAAKSETKAHSLHTKAKGHTTVATTKKPAKKS
ncbi:MAG TPA: hypothetical protein VHB27_19020 [Rhodopila sp.]|uniref:hypothetical protein n=1 Tax=Rhodopila sp. TaxID=2480087 RepID=UPI002CE65E0C|nr:hypothetical protein [Rhodopila sp.]HVY17323.1 hypothetical protein [Rhodopila sp.]